jgi:hypothetical protein
MAPVLDIFEHRFGDETVPRTGLHADDENSLGEAGMRMLDCIQTVVDVLSDAGAGYRVGFANTASAFTDHNVKRIIISGLPLTKAKSGTPYRDIAAVLTGFAVHEVGHTKRPGIIDAVRREWPGKTLPGTLGNIIEDVVLEARTVERYAGLRDVFVPTFEWVAKETCPTHTLVWKGSTGHKVNIIGQMVRYRDYVTFGTDAKTQDALRFFTDWGDRITAKTTPQQGVALVREALAYIHAPDDDEPEPEGEGEGEDEGEDTGNGGEPDGEGNPGKGNPGGDTEGLPDEDDDDEPDDTEGDGEGEGEDGEGESESGTEGEGEDESEGSGSADGDGEGEGEGNGPSDPDAEGETGHGLDADTLDRTTADKGANDGTGAGGSGQAVSEAGDVEDPDAGLDKDDLDKSFDEVAHQGNGYADRALQNAVDEERITTRLDAKEHGTMRVIFR